ncbi:2-keto-3-deoxygalactonate kinase [Methylobacterium phyllostachyos]|uniref:2-keto-3-deoxygalactonate kinase n=1 Tax=Methylobacterium phyllostachyos TaxID=582672 RepID=A0A1G9VGW8_9HYPH|nr:2-dehydro-3-deoxygalactonokinase [Methylobacterium phyllostachyos]SDM71307.1 2-keto-3-deoxygalactonate kinase [Methylobacterium phyllostachyos]
MGGGAAYIAVDWGTTNRRVFAMASDGTVIESLQDARGVLSLTQDAYPAEISALRSRFGAEDVIAVGMVGSSRGWLEAPYVDVPATLERLTDACRVAAPGVRIVPGVALRNGRRPDVMRGEEIQVLGAIHAGAAPATALFCQPGTHNKWVETVDGAITTFTTVMTGELFALLRGHGIMAGMLDGAVSDGAPFRRGLRRGIASSNIAATLFEVRAGLLLDRLAPSEAAAYASGVLIGADVATQEDLKRRPVHLLGGGSLSALYAVAITELGGTPVIVPDGATTAGIHAIWSLSA